MVMSLLLGKNATIVVSNWDVYHMAALELVVVADRISLSERANIGLGLGTMGGNDALLKRDFL